MKQLTRLKYLVNIATILALFVVMLGAYTRLTDAGLGCPDWPGCYGHMVLPQNQQALDQAGEHFQVRTIETQKAWTEMVHRYFAGTLGLLIFIIAGYSLRLSRRLGHCSTSKKEVGWVAQQQANLIILPCLLAVLVIFQALLGMWTVTLKLLPIVVMAHLLGGMLIFSLLSCFRMQLSARPAVDVSSGWRWFAGFGLFLLFCQIALGGWVSANYAGIACVGFPQCNGQWLPNLQWAKGFYLLSTVGANYQGGVLDIAVRITIQFIHRLGAYIVFIWLFIFLITAICNLQDKMLRLLACMGLVLLMLQIALGIINVTYILPLWIAVAHNGVAALLLAMQTVLFYLLRRARGAN